MIVTHQAPPVDRQSALRSLLANNRGNWLCLVDPLDLIGRQEPRATSGLFTAPALWEDEGAHDEAAAYIIRGRAQIGSREALCGQEGQYE